MSDSGHPSARSNIEAPYEPPIKPDTSFANLPRILAAIPKSADITLYRGLPSQFWEPALRTQELDRAKTIKLHGYPFYEELIPIQGADAGRLTALLSSKATFRRHDGKKHESQVLDLGRLVWRGGSHAMQSSRLHVDRTPRGHHDRRGAHRAVAAGGSGSTRSQG